ncbi:hypothetical protein [Nostocoides jenkinsii]|uniref:hypothetical protein n=1 Tax=Nostocoides jenkinsii TaxID=330834 RepID=UPI0012EDA969|nr:hypothetical protein [Tetrasphaera jenkinsii]
MTAIVPVNGLQLTVTGTTALPVKVGIRRCRPGLVAVGVDTIVDEVFEVDGARR